MKTCNKCKQNKLLKFFSKRKRSKDGLNTWCKSCVVANNSKNYHKDIEKSRLKSRQWDANNKDYIFEKELKHKFNITIVEYNEMLAKQNHRCFLCERHRSELPIRLSVDHCHTTGKIRGLLCGNCNRGLGCFKDNSNVLLKAAKYVKLIQES